MAADLGNVNYLKKNKKKDCSSLGFLNLSTYHFSHPTSTKIKKILLLKIFIPHKRKKMSKTTMERLRILFNRDVPVQPRFCRQDNQRSTELQFYLSTVHAGDVTVRKGMERAVIKKVEKKVANELNIFDEKALNFVGGNYYAPVLSTERQEINRRIHEALNAKTDFHRANLPLVLKVLS